MFSLKSLQNFGIFSQDLSKELVINLDKKYKWKESSHLPLDLPKKSSKIYKRDHKKREKMQVKQLSQILQTCFRTKTLMGFRRALFSSANLPSKWTKMASQTEDRVFLVSVLSAWRSTRN